MDPFGATLLEYQDLVQSAGFIVSDVVHIQLGMGKAAHNLIIVRHTDRGKEEKGEKGKE